MSWAPQSIQRNYPSRSRHLSSGLCHLEQLVCRTRWIFSHRVSAQLAGHRPLAVVAERLQARAVVASSLPFQGELQSEETILKQVNNQNRLHKGTRISLHRCRQHQMSHHGYKDTNVR